MSAQRCLALGDVHGGYKALMQCLERAKFDCTEDKLIVLGDVCDGWSQTRECIDELLKIKNLVFIIGNHDYWVLEWALSGGTEFPSIWFEQGGESTIQSYGKQIPPKEHIEFLKSGIPLYIDDKNRVFVHGGFDRKKNVKEQDQQVFMWDRELIQTAWNTSRQGGDKPFKMTEFEEVFVGHTPVSTIGGLDKPLNFFEIWDLDTGGGWEGKVTIMDIDTHKYWQSDVVYKLYPGEHGRQGQRIRRNYER